MKKNHLVLAFIFVFAGGLLFTGCDKDDQNSPVEPDLSKTTIIKGIVEANLTEKNDTLPQLGSTGIQMEKAPEGTVIHVLVDASEYTDNGDGVMKYSTEVDSNGEYSIEIPTINKSVGVTIFPTDFEYAKTVGEWVYDADDDIYEWEEEEAERTIYTAPSVNVNNLIPNSPKFIDITYNGGLI